MKQKKEDILSYLAEIKSKKEDWLENGNFKSIPSVAYSLEHDINALNTVIDIIREYD